MASQRPRGRTKGHGGTGLDRSTSMAFAFFHRRHSSAVGLRRSVSSVSSRRHSSPIANNPDEAISESLSDGEAENSGNSRDSHSGSKFPRNLKWRILAKKVLGNVEEEDQGAAGAGSNPDNNGMLNF